MHHKYILAFITVLLFTACGGDAPVKPLPEIAKLEDGRYNVVTAKRNGKATGTLDKAYYIIKGDSAFTNLTKTLDSTATKFAYKKNKITHTDPNALNFVVSKMTSDSLILNTELQGFTFEISFEKVVSNDNE